MPQKLPSPDGTQLAKRQIATDGELDAYTSIVATPQALETQVHLDIASRWRSTFSEPRDFRRQS